MKYDRRSFIALAAAGVAGCMTGKCGAKGDAEPIAPQQARFDDNFSIVFSDAHVCGEDARAAKFTPKRMLKRLEDAGIELVFCMGNHDRRSEFAKAWPGHLEKSPVPGKFVTVTSLGTADLVILDGLQGTDDRLLTDMGPGAGLLTPDQFAWLKKDFPKRTRPFFVASHFPIGELKVSDKKKFGDLGSWMLKHAPMCVGYLYGHLHRWRPEWTHGSWKDRKTLRTLCIPSGGLWGDIGYVKMHTAADRAVCSLELKDFYFPAEPEDPNDRPAPWKLKIEETRGATCTFLYDRQGV